MRNACKLLSLLLVALLVSSTAAAERRYFTERKADGGELRYIDRVPVLLVAGAPEEIGRQKGTLVGKEASSLIEFPKLMAKALGADEQLPKLLTACQQLVPQIPAGYAAELKSLSKQSGLPEAEVIGGNTLMDVYRGNWGCSSLLVEAERSKTKQPLFARNLDFPSFGMLDKYSLVTVYRPKGKHAFASIDFPGLVGVLSGMNDAGLCVAVHNVYRTGDGSPMFNPKGMPYTLCFRQMLEDCTTVAEAEKLLRDSPRTTMLNLGVCDLKNVAVFELTPNTVVVRKPERGTMGCTNHFRMEPLTVTKSCWRFDQLEKAQSEGPFSVEELEKKLHLVHQGPLTVQSMVFEPAALKLHVSLAGVPTSDGPYRELNLKELFEGK